MIPYFTRTNGMRSFDKVVDLPEISSDTEQKPVPHPFDG